MNDAQLAAYREGRRCAVRATTADSPTAQCESLRDAGQCFMRAAALHDAHGCESCDTFQRSYKGAQRDPDPELVLVTIQCGASWYAPVAR